MLTKALQTGLVFRFRRDGLGHEISEDGEGVDMPQLLEHAKLRQYVTPQQFKELRNVKWIGDRAAHSYPVGLGNEDIDGIRVIVRLTLETISSWHYSALPKQGGRSQRQSSRSCFWRYCPDHREIPAGRSELWLEKLRRAMRSYSPKSTPGTGAGPGGGSASSLSGSTARLLASHGHLWARWAPKGGDGSSGDQGRQSKCLHYATETLWMLWCREMRFRARRRFFPALPMARPFLPGSTVTVAWVTSPRCSMTTSFTS